MKQDYDSITPEAVRQVIVDFLQERLVNHSVYKSETGRLLKVEESNNLDAINESKNKLAELVEKFDFTNWMENAFTNRITWLIAATHLSKGIHPSSKALNVNYNTQSKIALNFAVSSSTIADLMCDATGAATALDIFVLLNIKIHNNITLMRLIIDDHPALIQALSDDPEKSKLYLSNTKNLLNNDFKNPSASALNKQFYWPIGKQSYLSSKENTYRLLIPLHPSSLCHAVFQKIQTRYSDENRQAQDQRFKKNAEQKPYFSYADLAVIHLGGSNAQNVSLMFGRQKGRNFLLPSLPPKINSSHEFVIKKSDKTIFSYLLQSCCWASFEELFAVIAATNNVKEQRDKRKEAIDFILATLFTIAKKIQTSRLPGWSKDYSLDMSQKCWLDPKRANITDEEKILDEDEFQVAYRNDWITELEKQFALWLNSILKKKFKDTSCDFDDAELREWSREFNSAVKMSLRHKEGIF